MIHVYDASAIVALLADEPSAADVEELLGTQPSRISAVNVAEIIDRLTRLGSKPSDEVRAVIDELTAHGLEVVPCDRALAIGAGEVRAQHCDRRDAAVSLADCIAVVTARAASGTLVTSDGDLLRVARALSIPTRPIANSRGVLPE
jgi:predicted nucleic acid-binding protein